MNEEVQKRLITILSGIIAYAVADRLADRFLDIPDQPGIADDVKEALIKSSFPPGLDGPGLYHRPAGR